MKKYVLPRALAAASCVLLTSAFPINAAEISAKIQVLDDVTSAPLRGVRVAVGTTEAITDASGMASVTFPNATPTLSIAYDDGKIYRIETFHGITAEPELTLRVPNTEGVRREAVFSVAIPFGPIQREARALLLLPQPSYESGGLNFGHFANVRLYQDQLQSDGKFSLMAVALDEGLIPYKYGYMLDLSPENLDEAHIHFKPPHTTGIDHARQLVHWRKQADAINLSDAAAECSFSTPPLTVCGLYPDKGGIFSWVNVWRRGQLFHTPGAFLPARTVGANPLLALPEGQIELVGHDDPLGFFPANFARHRFLRYATAPADPVNITMPNVIVGRVDDPGPRALTVDASGRGARFLIQVLGEKASATDQLDLGKLQMTWINPNGKRRTIWNQYFSPQAGDATISLAAIPESFSDRMPKPNSSDYENVQVWLYGSDGVDGYAAAIKAKMSGVDPMRAGANAFQVTRWR